MHSNQGHLVVASSGGASSAVLDNGAEVVPLSDPARGTEYPLGPQLGLESPYITKVILPAGGTQLVLASKPTRQALDIDKDLKAARGYPAMTVPTVLQLAAVRGGVKVDPCILLADFVLGCCAKAALNLPALSHQDKVKVQKCRPQESWNKQAWQVLPDTKKQVQQSMPDAKKQALEKFEMLKEWIARIESQACRQAQGNCQEDADEVGDEEQQVVDEAVHKRKRQSMHWRKKLLWQLLSQLQQQQQSRPMQQVPRPQASQTTSAQPSIAGWLKKLRRPQLWQLLLRQLPRQLLLRPCHQ